jgi:hypothetical protein
MRQLTWDRLRHGPPRGIGQGSLPAAAGIAGVCGRCGDPAPAAGFSLLHRLGCLGTWFRSDEGPPLTPKEEEERWRLLFRCGF